MRLPHEHPVGRGDPLTALPHFSSLFANAVRAFVSVMPEGQFCPSVFIFLSEEIQAYSESGTCLKPHTDGADSLQWGQPPSVPDGMWNTSHGLGCGTLHVGWGVEYFTWVVLFHCILMS